MNTFLAGDRVMVIANNRKHGSVVCIFCSFCSNCLSKQFKNCTASHPEKTKVLAIFPDIEGKYKKYKYDYLELSKEPPLSLKQEKPVLNLLPTDIQKLGSANLDIPLIEFEEDEPEPSKEPEEQRSEPRASVESSIGISFDEFLAIRSKMGQPV